MSNLSLDNEVSKFEQVENLIAVTSSKFEVMNKLKDEESIKSFIISTEKLANMSRLIPFATGYANAREILDEAILLTDYNFDKDIYLTKEQFYIKIPLLLPKKEGGDALYIRGFTQTVMDKYFENKDYDYFKEHMFMVTIYNYRDNSLNIRDHSNIEFNVVEDVLSSFLLKDDSPKNLSHIFMSRFNSKSDFTEIYFIKASEIVNFLAVWGDIV